ncbi:hypothetical protein [Chlorobium sp. N1]|uniref:hypothetical protein n=1 Tax=Chlorobium sp. N1 TaxID=2491138 RepID=UPI00103A6622|nr:hypothetical protein [Chlorobium sp. N1]TCD47667.1 hypothetical protein E0L29_07405 [Chlorobium sp. N1]
MKQKARALLYAFMAAAVLLLAVFTLNQIASAARLLEALVPYGGIGFTALSAGVLLWLLTAALRFLSRPRRPPLPKDEASKEMASYARWMGSRMPAHPAHPDPRGKRSELRWVRTNLKLLEADALGATKEMATKNFFVGAFAQSTAYGTTTSLFNMMRLIWRIYTMHHREQNFREFIELSRGVYELLPLSDFQKEEIPAHIKPIIQSSFSNTLSSLLPAGNLLTPFFLNLFMAGSTNAYLTCLAGMITARRCQMTTEEDQREIVQQSMFEAAFMLKEIVRECNPVLSVTISQAVKKAGLESLDTVPTPGGGGIAEGLISHLANSVKHIIRENISTEKEGGEPRS